MWNYRVFRYEQDEENKLYISECYYDDKKELKGYVSPLDIFNKGLWDENLDGLREVLHMLLQATTRPIIIISEDESIREET